MQVRREAGALERFVAETDEASVEVYLQGATVTKFQPRGREPVLWLSPTSAFSPGKAIRGGVPICFPWFGPKTSLVRVLADSNVGDASAPQHGFARTALWSFDGSEGTTLRFSLEQGGFGVRYEVTVGSALELALSAENRGDAPAIFEVALHSYFHVSDVERIRIRGLEGTPYVDKVAGGARSTQGGLLALTGPTDRVFLGTTSTVAIEDGGRTITIEKEGSRSTVIWNPWGDKARTMADMGGPDAWRTMVCVETANALDDAVTLAPGATHVTRTRIAVSG